MKLPKFFFQGSDSRENRISKGDCEVTDKRGRESWGKGVMIVQAKARLGFNKGKGMQWPVQLRAK